MTTPTKLAAALFVAALAGCTQPDHARQVLEGQGYTEIQMQGYDLLNCSEDDMYRDKFTAKGPTGKEQP